MAICSQKCPQSKVSCCPKSLLGTLIRGRATLAIIANEKLDCVLC